jgi:hypothetical protein
VLGSPLPPTGPRIPRSATQYKDRSLSETLAEDDAAECRYKSRRIYSIAAESSSRARLVVWPWKSLWKRLSRGDGRPERGEHLRHHE